MKNLILLFFTLFFISPSVSYSKSIGLGLEAGIGISEGLGMKNYYSKFIKDWKQDIPSYKGESSLYTLGFSTEVFFYYKYVKYLGFGTGIKLLSLGNKLKMKTKGKNSISQRHYYLTFPLRVLRIYYTDSLSLSLGPEIYYRLHSTKHTILDGKRNEKKYNKIPGKNEIKDIKEKYLDSKDPEYRDNFAKGLKKGKTNFAFKDAFNDLVFGFTGKLDYEFQPLGLNIGLEVGITTGFIFWMNVTDDPFIRYDWMGNDYFRENFDWFYMNLTIGYNFLALI